MKRKRLWAVILAVALLAGIGLAGCEAGPAPTPTPTQPPSRLTWLHGFYAGSSYGQIHLAQDMDAVSLGWGQLYVTEAGEPYVNSAYTQGNSWVIPQSAHLATDRFDELAIPYNLCVYATAGQSFGETNVLEYAISAGVRQETARALARAAADYSGLTVDFEGLASLSRREDFTAFMALVRQELRADQLLYVAVPPRTWYKGYDYRALGEICDKVILMAHDYQWTRAPEENLGSALTDTPVAPIAAVEEALKQITDPETGVEDLSKVALAIAFASAGVAVDEEGLLLDTRVYAPAPDTLARRLAQADAELGWSEAYASPYVYYHDEDGVRYRVWYEDRQSVAAKVELALQYGVTGLSLWRLGTVPDFDNYDVWPAVHQARWGETGS